MLTLTLVFRSQPSLMRALFSLAALIAWAPGSAVATSSEVPFVSCYAQGGASPYTRVVVTRGPRSQLFGLNVRLRSGKLFELVASGREAAGGALDLRFRGGALVVRAVMPRQDADAYWYLAGELVARAGRAKLRCYYDEGVRWQHEETFYRKIVAQDHEAVLSRMLGKLYSQGYDLVGIRRETTHTRNPLAQRKFVVTATYRKTRFALAPASDLRPRGHRLELVVEGMAQGFWSVTVSKLSLH